MKTIFTITAIAFLSAGINAKAADGKAVFAKECEKCHGADGKGNTTMGKKLSIKDLTTTKVSDAQIEKAIKDGITTDGKLRMKAIKGLSDEDVKAVAKYVHTLK